MYLPKPCLQCNLRCVSNSSFKPSLKPLLLQALPVRSVSQSSSCLEKAAFLSNDGMDISVVSQLCTCTAPTHRQEQPPGCAQLQENETQPCSCSDHGAPGLVPAISELQGDIEPCNKIAIMHGRPEEEKSQ